MFAQRRAYSMVEVMVVLIIAALTVTIGITLYNPKERTAHDAAMTQLEELKDAIVLYNAQNPQGEFQADNFDPGRSTPWWDLLPGINRPNLTDPWGSAYRHDYFRGCVYSTGSNVEDDGGEPDDLVVFYRPPSAEIMVRIPSPNSVVADKRPDISTEWRLAGSASLESATVYVDKKPVASSETLPPPYDTIPSPIMSSAPSGKYVTAVVAVLGINLPEDLADGAHEVQVRIRDTLGNSRRTSWAFRVDTKVPEVYAFNPAPGSTFEFQNPLVSCLFNDASGIDLQSISFDITTGGGSIFTAAPLAYAALNAPITLTDGGASHAKLSSSGLSWRPPVSGLAFETYTAKLTIADAAGNATSSPVTWSWTIDDSTEPQIQIQQPVFGSALTTDCDLDQDPSNGTQIAVVGTTERNLTVSLDVIHAGSTVVSAMTTQSNASGYFVFPQVLIKDRDISLNDVPLNDIIVHVTDAYGNAGEARTTVYLFNANNRLTASVRADPMTTKPGDSITFSVWADRGTTPYTYVWDFNDGYTREGVITTPMATESVSHTYLATGAFVVKCQVTDQTGLTASASQQIYVGTEATAPALHLQAVPLEVFCGAPGMGTQFQIKIGGKYLGFWRLHVESTPQSVPGYLWYFSSAMDKMCRTTHIDNDEPDPTVEFLWQSASSNDFVVEWDGIDNYYDSGISFTLNPLRKFPSNRMTGPTNRQHTAVLEYIDALGDKVVTTCPVVVYQGTPQPRGMQIYSVNRIPNSPQLYDQNLDGVFDYTNANKIDIMTITPESTNPTDWWLSNFPIELHNVVYNQPSQNAITGYSFAGGIAPDGEVFHNWTMESGVTYSAVDGSSGWMPLDLTEREKPDGTHFAWDWPLTAWPETDLGQLLNAPNFAKFTPAWNYPESAWQSALVSGTNQWLALGSPGMNLAYDGPKRVYAIFRDAGVFPSTQVIGTGAEKASAGVTSVAIFLDRTPPRPVDPPRFTNLEVVGNWSDLSSLSVIATIAVTAEDLSDTGYGLLWGSGLVPNGMVIVRGGTLGVRQVPYRSEVTYDFGSLYKADGTSNLPNIAPNSTLKAVVTYRDNLGNQSVAPAVPTSIDQAQATISKFTWTLVGGGGLNFYRKHDQFERILYSYKQNLDSSEPRTLDAGLRDDIDAAAPTVDHWKLNGAALNTTSNTGSKKYEDRVVWDSSNIDPGHFPNPNDRLGYLQSRRPWFPWSVEQEATFEVDNLHYYYLILLKADPYVEYRVYKGLKSNGNCEPLGVAAKALPADFIENSGNFSFVASIDKVAWSNFNPARVNEGCMRLPGEDAVPADNDQALWRDLHASNGDLITTPMTINFPNYAAMPSAYDPSKHWDQVTDLLIEDSTAGTKYETYTYRGCLFDYDGGTVRNVYYKVAANSFAVKAGFVTTPGDALVTNIYSGSNEGYHKKLIKAELVKQDVDPTSNGFGIKILNSFIQDVGYAGYPPLASGMVSGNTFRIKYSDYSNDFSWMTTGTVRPCIRLEFDGAAPTAASPFNPARVTTSGALVANNIVQPTTAAWYLPAITDYRGYPTVVSPDITWNILDGAEGTITAHLTYMDQESNQLTDYVTTAQMDANPPQLGIHGIRLWSYPGHGVLHPAGSTFERSGDATMWTSMNQFTIDYSDCSEVTGFYREFNAAPPAAINVWASYNAWPSAGTAGAFDIYGSAAPAPNGNTARWRSVTGAFPETCTWVRNWASATPGEQGLNTLYLRLKDASNNVAPVPTPTTDDGQQNGEPTFTAAINRDTKSPTSGNVTVTAVTADRLLRSRFGIAWTNDEAPRFAWTSTEPTAGGVATNSGIIGANVSIDQAGAATNPADVYPPQIPTVSGLEEQTESFSVDGTNDLVVPLLAGDGRKRFAAEAVDLTGNMNSLTTTDFNFDTAGPVIRPGMSINYRVYVSPNAIDRYTANEGAWSATKELTFGSMPVDTIRFSCTKGTIRIRDVVLWNGGTQRWPSSGNWDPKRDPFEWDWGTLWHDADIDGYTAWNDNFTRQDLYNILWIKFYNAKDKDDESYKVDDLRIWDQMPDSSTDTILADGDQRGWIRKDMNEWSTGNLTKNPGNAIRFDVDDQNKTYGLWTRQRVERLTLRQGESFVASFTSTTATKVTWQDFDRSWYIAETRSNTTGVNLSEDNWRESSIDFTDLGTWNVGHLRLEVDIDCNDRDDIRIELQAPDGTTNGRVWDYNGGSTNNLKGIFEKDFWQDDWWSLHWKDDWNCSPDYNGAGVWKLRVYNDKSGGRINSWKLTIYGYPGTNPSGEYVAQVLGPGFWLPSATTFDTGTIPVNLVSNSTKVVIDWPDLVEGGTADDPGYDGTLNGTGIGCAAGDAQIPDCWGTSVIIGESPDEWSYQAASITTFVPPQGDVRIRLAARDLLGNTGPGVDLMKILSDSFPPEMGALTATRGAGIDIPNDPATTPNGGETYAGCITTDAVVYHLAVSDPESGVQAYSYKMTVGAPATPVPATDGIHPVAPVVNNGTIHITVNTGSTPPLPQGSKVYFNVMVQDLAGTWSETYSSFCIRYIDRVSPVGSLAAIPDGNPDTVNFNNVIQMNRRQHFQGGANYALTGSSTDTGGVGIDRIRVSVNGGTTWNTVYTDGSSPWNTTQGWTYGWPDPVEDGDNINGGTAHAIRVEVRDACGNLFDSTLQTVYVDTVVPAAPAVTVPTPLNEPDVMTGTKVGNFSYLLVLTTTPMPAIPAAAPAPDAGVTANTAVGQFISGTAVNYTFGNSPMDTTGNIHVYTRDGAGNVSPATNLYINNPCQITGVTVTGSSGALTLNVTLTDPDAPDRAGSLTTKPRITALKWQVDDEDYPPLTLRTCNDLGSGLPYAGVYGLPQTWSIVWNSDAQNPPNGANSLKDVTGPTKLTIQATANDGKSGDVTALSAVQYDLDNDDTPNVYNASRSSPAAIHRGFITFVFSTSDADISPPVPPSTWDNIDVKLQYSENNSTWIDVPDAHLSATCIDLAAVTNKTITWDSGATTGMPHVAPTVWTRFVGTDRQGESDTENVATVPNPFELRNDNNAPVCVIDETNLLAVGFRQGNVNFDIDVSDADYGIPAETVNVIAIDWSSDGGSTWNAATVVPGLPVNIPNAELNSALPAPNGVRTFTWNTDTGGLRGVYLNGTVQLRVTVQDTFPTNATDTTVGIRVDNNEVPGITCARNPGTDVYENITFDWTITGDGTDPSEHWWIQFKYTGPDGTATDLPVATDVTSATGSWTWDSRAALFEGHEGLVTPSFRVRDDSGEGWSAWIATPAAWTGDNNDDPAVTVTRDKDNRSITFDWTVSGDNDPGEQWDIEMLFDGTNDSWATVATNGAATGSWTWNSEASIPAGTAASLTVKFRVKDNVGAWSAWDDESFTFFCNNSDPPIISNISHAGSGSPITLTFDLADADNNSPPDFTIQLQYSLDGGTTWKNSDSNDKTAPEGTGQTYSWATLTENGTLNDAPILEGFYSTNVKIRMRGMDPVAWGSYTAPYSIPLIDTNDQATVTVTKSGTGGSITYNWTIAGDNDPSEHWWIEYKFTGPDGSGTDIAVATNVTATTGSWTWNSIAAVSAGHEGTVTPQFRIRDDSGEGWVAYAGTPAPFAVDNNADPTVSVARTLTSNVIPLPWTISGDADPAEHWTIEMSYAGVLSGTSTIVPDTTSLTGTYNWDSTAAVPAGQSGSITLKFRVKDDVGAWSAWTADDTFSCNNSDPPIVSYVSYAAPGTGSPGTITFDITDADNTGPYDVGLSYSLNGGGTWQDGGTFAGVAESPPSRTISWNTLAAAGIGDGYYKTTVLIKLRGKDPVGWGNFCADETITVDTNDLPTITSAAPANPNPANSLVFNWTVGGDTGEAGESRTIVADYTGPNGSASDVAVYSGTNTSGSWTFNTPLALTDGTSGNITVTLKIKDDSTEPPAWQGTWGSGSLAVNNNDAPVCSALVSGAATAKPTRNITCTVTDPDDGSHTFVLQHSGSNTVATGSSIANGWTWNIQDDLGLGFYNTSYPVRIQASDGDKTSAWLSGNISVDLNTVPTGASAVRSGTSGDVSFDWTVAGDTDTPGELWDVKARTRYLPEAGAWSAWAEVTVATASSSATGTWTWGSAAATGTTSGTAEAAFCARDDSGESAGAYTSWSSALSWSYDNR